MNESIPKTPIRIFDTTLRDGEQSPGASLNHQQKMEIAHQLEDLGVDVIEAGFPITSQGDFEAVQEIGQALKNTTVAALCRCVQKDIDRAGEALKGAHKPRIHVLGAGSKIHLERKIKKTPQQMIEMTRQSVAHARNYTDDIEYSPEDGSRTELNFLVEVTQAAIEAGATTINLPDTVGYAVPAEYGHIFSYVREKLPVIDEKAIILSAHCHNDLGLATINSLAAIQNGARQVECTVNGIGERAGNAALEEIVMALRTRSDYYQNFTTNINYKKIYSTSRMVSSLTGIAVQRNKAIVGENAFAHESGIHQDGILKDRKTYEIIDPSDIGVPEHKLVLGKHSGRHALKVHIANMGYTINEVTLNSVYEKFKALADQKKNIYDEDIEALVDDQLDSSQAGWELVRFHVTSGMSVIATATLVLRDSQGNQKIDAATGGGPINAVFSAIQRITGMQVELEEYQSRGVTGGQDAQGETIVRVRCGDHAVSGRGYSIDVVEAAARAFLSAINRIESGETRRHKNNTK